MSLEVLLEKVVIFFQFFELSLELPVGWILLNGRLYFDISPVRSRDRRLWQDQAEGRSEPVRFDQPPRPGRQHGNRDRAEVTVRQVRLPHGGRRGSFRRQERDS